MNKKNPKKPQKKAKIRNKAPKSRAPIMGNTGSMTMMGY